VLLAFIDYYSCPVYYFDKPSGNAKSGLALYVIQCFMEFLLFLFFDLHELVFEVLLVCVELLYPPPRCKDLLVLCIDLVFR
jgi:hypothetical protein